MTKTTARLGSQEFSWLLVADLEMAPPGWGRPLRGGDVRAIATAFDPDMLGAVAVWARMNLAVGRGRYVIVDGQHRCAAIRLLGWEDQRVPCILYHGLTQATAADLSLGLQDRRNLHAYDKWRAALAAHERRATEIDKVLRHQGLEFAYTAQPGAVGRITAIAAVGLVWDRLGAPGLERVLAICAAAWENTTAGYASQMLRLVMTLTAAHDGAVDDGRLAGVLAKRAPAQWMASMHTQTRSVAMVAQEVTIEYNKSARGRARLKELTPTGYVVAARRPQAKTTRGEIDGRLTATAGHVRRTRAR